MRGFDHETENVIDGPREEKWVKKLLLITSIYYEYAQMKVIENPYQASTLVSKLFVTSYRVYRKPRQIFRKK